MEELIKYFELSEDEANFIKGNIKLTYALMRSKEFDDRIKDGTVLDLPCKVGDTLYKIVKRRGKFDGAYFPFIKKTKLTFYNMEKVLELYGVEFFDSAEEAFTYFIENQSSSSFFSLESISALEPNPNLMAKFSRLEIMNDIKQSDKEIKKLNQSTDLK